VEGARLDAEVYWEGRLVGYLRGIVIDQPLYRGAWIPTGDSEFEQAYRALQARVAPNGLGMLPVTLRSPNGSLSAPAAAMVRPAVAEPYFRFGGSGSAPVVVHEPRYDPAQPER
jgi:hypothetical protein